MLVQDTDNLCHLCFDAREALGRLAFKLQVSTFILRKAPNERRLVLDDLGYGFFEPVVAILRSCALLCQASGPLTETQGPSLSLIGATGFEPATSWSQTTRSKPG